MRPLPWRRAAWCGKRTDVPDDSVVAWIPDGSPELHRPRPIRLDQHGDALRAPLREHLLHLLHELPTDSPPTVVRVHDQPVHVASPAVERPEQRPEYLAATDGKDQRLTCDKRHGYDATSVAAAPPVRRSVVPKKAPERLTRREREIMNALFALGNRASAEEIRARLTDPPGDSSVRVMLARLESKGLLRHQRDGLRYIYSATISPAVAKRTALQQYVETFFGGSLRQLMTALVREGSWSEGDLEALRAEIDRARKERKPR